MRDVVIIGAGAAGLSAALYAGRASLDAVVVERYNPSGSQIIYADAIDNYPGMPGISGFDLMKKFRDHVGDRARFVQGEAKELKRTDAGFVIKLSNGSEIESRTVVAAMGAVRKKLGVTGEEEFAGKGVSYCATCDGAFYKGKDAAVAGGGDSALSEALYLSNICRRVYLLHRRNELRGAASYQNQVKAKPNIEFIGNALINEIKGTKKVESIAYRGAADGVQRQLEADALFVAIGAKPDSDIVSGMVETDENGYIKAGEDGKTSVPGIFTAGDVRTKNVRQLITAAADGACCIKSVEEHLRA